MSTGFVTRNKVQSLDRALEILKLLGSEPEMRVTDLARRLEVHKSTVFRLLSTLQEHGLVEQNPSTEKYRLGYGLVRLAGSVVSELDLARVARPVLEELALRSGETVNLAILQGSQVVNIDQIAAPNLVVNVNWVGKQTPLHATSNGKVLLAYLPEAERQRLLAGTLPRLTPRTITDPRTLEKQVGRRFEKGDFFVPEMLIAARAMQGALVILRPLIAETGAKPIGKYVIGTVKGDIHDIGKNLVIIMLEGAGFEVVDLGVNCPPEKFVEAVRTNEPHIVGFSAFLTTTMPMFKVNIQALEKAGLRDKVTVMVGGAPVTEEYAKLAGADHYAPDASFATRMAKQIVGAAQAAENAALTQAVELIEQMLRKG